MSREAPSDLRSAIEDLIAPHTTRDAVSGRLSATRKVHVRVRDLRAILDATERNACDIASITSIDRGAGE
jgi:hypothetical protein